MSSEYILILDWKILMYDQQLKNNIGSLENNLNNWTFIQKIKAEIESMKT